MLTETVQQDHAIKPYKQIPLVRSIPLIGSAYEMLARPQSFFSNSIEKYGRLNRVRLGTKEVVCIHSAENLEQMLLKDSNSYNKSPRALEILYPLLGNSVGTAVDLDYWSMLRVMLQPMFTPKMLATYFEGTREAIGTAVRRLEVLKRGGKTVHLEEFVRESVFLALAKTLFTDGLSAEEIPGLLQNYTQIAPYMATRYLAGESFLVELLPRARQGKKSLATVNERIDKLINQRRAKSVAKAADMLDVMLMSRDNNGRPLSHEAIRHNVMTLFFGGQETTPGTITWALGLLAANPEKRRKMLDEIDGVLDGRLPSYTDLAKLKYTEMVVDETLRLYPMFPYLERRAVQDTVLGGYEIRKGTSLYIVASTTQKDPRYWPEPDRFMPERHTIEGRKTRPKCASVPFGYGQRRCIGERVGRMEAVLTLAMLSQKYLLEHVSGRLPETLMLMSPKPKGGMEMNVVSR